MAKRRSLCLDLYAPDDGLVIGYPRLMWVFVAYDLPVDTPEARKVATRFHTTLDKLGYTRFQFSIYARFCGSQASTEVSVRDVSAAVPKGGKVAIFTLTDKQYGRMILYENRKKTCPSERPEQLLLL